MHLLAPVLEFLGQWIADLFFELIISSVTRVYRSFRAYRARVRRERLQD
ncbi:hypothetical protein Q0M94_04735 [Deinococcus radiomollis]